MRSAATVDRGLTISSGWSTWWSGTYRQYWWGMGRNSKLGNMARREFHEGKFMIKRCRTEIHLRYVSNSTWLHIIVLFQSKCFYSCYFCGVVRFKCLTYDMFLLLCSVSLQQLLVLIHSLWCGTVLETLRMRPSVKEQPGSSPSREPLWVVISVMMW